VKAYRKREGDLARVSGVGGNKKRTLKAHFQRKRPTIYPSQTRTLMREDHVVGQKEETGKYEKLLQGHLLRQEKGILLLVPI